MTVDLTVVTRTHISVSELFARSLSIDRHLESMAHSDETAVGGVTGGTIGLGEQVTWRARHFGVWWTMTSRITALEPGAHFVDEQVRGPFRRFRHEHLFDHDGELTVMTDRISFDAPAGPVGDLVERLVLGRYLRHLIEVRNASLVDG